MNELFRKFAQKTSQVVGSSWAFILAVLLIVVWAGTGPIFNFASVSGTDRRRAAAGRGFEHFLDVRGETLNVRNRWNS